MDKDKKLSPFTRYWLNVAIAYDQLWNARFGGDPDETVSSRLGKTERKHGGAIPWYHPVRRFIAHGLNKIDDGHCREAIEEDEGTNALHE